MVAEPIKDWRYYVTKITAAWQKSVDGIIETGAWLLEAKDKVEHGKFEEMIERELPFGPRAARMLMDIARNPVLSDRNRGSVLPPSWRTLYELSRLDEPVLLAKIEDHTINPEMERRDVVAIAATVAGRAVRRIKAKRRDGPTLLDENVALINEIDGLKAEIKELYAAREATGFSIETDDMRLLAEKILARFSEEQVSELIIQLKLGAASSETAA